MAKQKRTTRIRILIVALFILVAVLALMITLFVSMANHEGQVSKKTAEDAEIDSKIQIQDAMMDQIRAGLKIHYLNRGYYPDDLDEIMEGINTSEIVDMPIGSYSSSGDCYILMYTNDYSGEFKTYTCDS